jgi:hypothetical protein
VLQAESEQAGGREDFVDGVDRFGHEESALQGFRPIYLQFIGIYAIIFRKD